MKKKNLHFVFSLATAFALTLAMGSAASSAVTEQVIYTFTGVSSGFYPLTKLLYVSGKFYGATSGGGGGCKCGAFYELTPKSGGGWTYHELYSFKGGADGSTPVGNIVADAAGDFYGVTGSGGSGRLGTVYEMSPGTGGKWTHKVIYWFGEGTNDGAAPDAGLIIDSAGNLYGTTTGAPVTYGNVFELSLGSNGLWNLTSLHDFTGSDGASPRAELIMDAAGNLYGTTFSGGGANSDGVVFELSPSSGGGWTESVLYSFTGGQDQGHPQAPVWMDSKGNLYGTTIGTSNNILFGTVFELTPTTSGPWTETTLHTFGLQTKDGQVPAGGLTPDGKGNLYGTTTAGGINYAGTIYKLTPAAGGAWNYHLYYTFTSGSNGGNPSTPVTLGAAGNIFGPTTGGPDNGNIGAQVVYEIKP